MGDITRVGDLEISEDMAFQRREWVIERIGWGVMSLTLLAGLIGVFGHGPLADATARGESGAITVDYTRLDRRLAPTEVFVEIAPGTAQNRQVEIWIARSFLDDFAIDSISPEPSDTRAGPDRASFQFAITDPSQPARITLHGEFDHWGIIRGELGIVDGDDVSFRQLIYP